MFAIIVIVAAVIGVALFIEMGNDPDYPKIPRSTRLITSVFVAVCFAIVLSSLNSLIQS